MNKDVQFRSQLDKALNDIEVPESLLQFAQKVPDMYEAGVVESPSELTPTARTKIRFSLVFAKTAAAVLIIMAALMTGMKVSPAFASYMKDVPGFHIALNWLTGVREQDGVQVAVNNGYTPIEPVTTHFDKTTITISDVYLTDEELLFKAFIRTEDFDVLDSESLVDYFIAPANLRGDGSISSSSIAETVGSEGPVLSLSFKYLLEENAVREFLAKGNNSLLLEVTKHTANHELQRSEIEKKTVISLPVDRTKLLHNRVLEPKQELAVSSTHLNLNSLVLEKLTLQPTSMNVIIAAKQGLTLEFPRGDANAPYLRDEKGTVYRYDPSGSTLFFHNRKVQLPFMSSIFFEPDVKKLYLHIGTVYVSETEPSAQFDLSLHDRFPKTIQFKNKKIVIEGAAYKDGYLHLKVKKEHSSQSRMANVYFDIPEYRDHINQNKELRKKYEALRISGVGTAQTRDSSGPSLDLYILAPEQEQYSISLRRINDPIKVNKDFPITIQ